MNRATILKNIKEGEVSICPHCEGRKGKTELLYHFIPCYLCNGVGSMKIDKIVEVDKKYGDIKCTFTVNTNNSSYPRLNTKTTWMI